VLVAGGRELGSSVAAVSIAAAQGYPLVLVNPSSGECSLPAGTARAILIGGTDVVSRTAERKLKVKLGVARVSRVTGADRYATAAAISKRAVSMKHTWDGVTVLSTSRPIEAICGAVMAGRMGTVVLCTTAGSLPAPTRKALTGARNRIDGVHVFGSGATVAPSAASAIKKAAGG
jgi:putative cell wall-binding protein